MTFNLRKIKSVLFSAVVLSLAGTVTVAAGVLLGDADADGKVTIIDATCVQRYLADSPVGDSFSEEAADVDASGEIEITDATFIQRWAANIGTPYPIAEQPTEAPTQRPTDSEGWGRDIFRP